MKKAIILANGKSPGKKLVKTLIHRDFNFIVCADGGANSARKMNLIPDLIIGDLDSIKNDVLEFYKNKCLVKKISRQNDTDVEKALKFLIQKKFNEVILLGATGDRLDHSFCNLGIALKFQNKISIKIIHENSILCAVSGKLKIKTIPGEYISLYGFDKRTKFRSKGLKYPLNSISLKFGEKESTSNQSIKEEIELSITGGTGFIVRNLRRAFECDFI